MVWNKFKIKTLEIKIKPHYISTALSLTDQSGRERKISHYQYTAWPRDKFAHKPDALIDFLHNVNDTYVNLEKQAGKKPAPMILHSLEDGYLEAIKLEYYQVVTTLDFGSFENFFEEENEGKNRYEDIPCWDRTRVTVTPGKDNSDYIHANYVDSFGSPKKFIATQGPLKETIEEFWQMAWDQNSYIIVMLTDFQVSGVEKCARYWGIDKDHALFTCTGKFLVSIISETKESGYVESAGWPDFKTPTNSLLFINFILAVNSERQRLLREAVNGLVPGPIIVHCSSVTGRTGTFCAVDTCIYQLVKTETVSVPGTVMKIRSQRYSSVVAPEQYRHSFFWAPILRTYGLPVLDTLAQHNDDLTLVLPHHSPEVDSCRVHRRLRADELLRVREAIDKTKNKKRNRYSDVPCWDVSRVVLYKTYDGSDYINASYMAGYDNSKKFIATQEPMPITFNDFWHMVWQEDSRIIVMLNGAEKKLQAECIQYFAPNQDNTILKEFIIKEGDIKLEQDYSERILHVTYIHTGEIRTIHHFKHLDWPESGDPNTRAFINFLTVVNKTYQNFFVEALTNHQPLPGPIVVHSDAGVGRTGGFIAADICLYRLIYSASVSVPSLNSFDHRDNTHLTNFKNMAMQSIHQFWKRKDHIGFIDIMKHEHSFINNSSLPQENLQKKRT
ncbi:hypothetical protein PR048_017771 [Dryococelus australis]|uniref:Protein tyrosine phosphatase n=1 Tax=Dryococelus australis TaxID=614101 RepID=A0ABQ9HAK8_9NEOP|nr:hypothetical protein PR048_017771 [Dryococelus australis]